MKKPIVVLLPLIVLVIFSQACMGRNTSKTPKAVAVKPPSSPDLQLTIDAAVEATCGAQAEKLAVGTLISRAVTETVTPRQVVPTPTPTEAIEKLSEVKLGALINERVLMAKKAVSLASSSTLQGVADGAITENEYDNMNTYWRYSGDLIAYADEGIAVYFNVYGGLAAGTLEPLNSGVSDMKVVSRQVQAILPVLEKVGLDIAHGKVQSDAAIRQLKTAADIVETKATEASQHVKSWSGNLQMQAQNRVNQALSVKPQRVAKTRKAAINRAHDYIALVKKAVADQKITQPELNNIAQLGANATASLTAQGSAQLAELAGSVAQITTQLAGGQITAALDELESFQAELPAGP
jgi:hypothetical protein